MADMTSFYKDSAIDLFKQVLAHENLTLNEEECTVVAALEYMGVKQMLGSYTIYDWISDTKENYPECFK